MAAISVVMPAYNAEKYIKEAMDSILNQTFTDFEFIIIDDGSSDHTAEIIHQYADSRIKYIKNEVNSGIVVSLNKGLDYATGKYIARMDSDDISHPTRFEKQYDYMEKHSDVAALGTAIHMFGEGMEEQDRLFDTDSNTIKANLLFHSCMAHPTAFIRKAVFDKNNLRYSTEFVGIEDFDLWWKIAAVGNISILKDVLLSYRIHGGQITQTYSDADYLRQKNFLDKRLNDIGVMLSQQEETAFIEYCRGQYEKWNDSSMRAFVNALVKIVENNTKTHYFSHYHLRSVCAFAMFGAFVHSHLSDKEKRQIQKSAVKHKLIPVDVRLKHWVHSLF